MIYNKLQKLILGFLSDDLLSLDLLRITLQYFDQFVSA